MSFFGAGENEGDDIDLNAVFLNAFFNLAPRGANPPVEPLPSFEATLAREMSLLMRGSLSRAAPKYKNLSMIGLPATYPR